MIHAHYCHNGTEIGSDPVHHHIELEYSCSAKKEERERENNEHMFLLTFKSSDGPNHGARRPTQRQTLAKHHCIDRHKHSLQREKDTYDGEKPIAHLKRFLYLSCERSVVKSFRIVVGS